MTREIEIKSEQRKIERKIEEYRESARVRSVV